MKWCKSYWGGSPPPPKKNDHTNGLQATFFSYVVAIEIQTGAELPLSLGDGSPPKTSNFYFILIY
jgi:hypothetical protein